MSKGNGNWYEQFFDGVYEKVLGSEDKEIRAAEEAKRVKRLLRLRRGRRVLDCPCGLGRLTRALARLGLEMTGADLADRYVRKARRLTRQAGLEAEFLRCDMRELPFEGEFHAVVNWFTSIGYFDGEGEGDLAAVRAAWRALRPGGQFLVETMNKSWLLDNFDPGPREMVSGGVRILDTARWDDEQQRVRSTWRMTAGRKTVERQVSIRTYNGTDMRRLLERAGFTDIRICSNPGLKRLTRHHHRLIAIGTRPTG